MLGLSKYMENYCGKWEPGFVWNTEKDKMYWNWRCCIKIQEDSVNSWVVIYIDSEIYKMNINVCSASMYVCASMCVYVYIHNINK